ncbi:unnamed protein product [Linum tenue]|uniref:FAR1 domain-containing protein n=1 Tax=Linum tenue TaxID=586396 RepID=A0AAV0PTH1_9ROSI|nr:unnamed protein product [Linum tenue]
MNISRKSGTSIRERVGASRGAVVVPVAVRVINCLATRAAGFGRTWGSIFSPRLEPGGVFFSKLRAGNRHFRIRTVLGQEFDSEVEAVEFYCAYAQRVGFAIRMGDLNRARDGSMISRRIVCNKEGYRKSHRYQQKQNLGTSAAERKRRHRAVTRVGGKAKVGFTRQKSGRWVVKSLEHTHPLAAATQLQDQRSIGTRVYQIPAADERIRQLSDELLMETKRSASLRGYVDQLLNHIEEHTEGLTRKIQHIVEKVKKIDSEGNNSDELLMERKRSASLRGYVDQLLNHIEEHTEGLTRKIQHIVEKVKKIV